MEKLWSAVKLFLYCSIGLSGRGVIVVRAHASSAEGLRFESDSMP